MRARRRGRRRTNAGGTAGTWTRRSPSVAATVPHTPDTASRQSESVTPGMMILFVVSQIVAAPSAPQPSRSWPRPWATATMVMPFPAESASHTSSGTRTIWRASSSASSSGGSSFPAARREPERLAMRCT